LGVLLERARRALGGSVPELPPAQPYGIVCACGQQLSGFRLDHRQFVPCSACGQIHLVLPTSSYPRPIVYETPSSSDPVNVEVVHPERPLGVRMRLGLRRTGRAGARFLWGLVPPARWFSAVRLTIMSMFLVVAGTIWLTVHWSGRGTLASDIVALRAGATSDIEAGDFAQARLKLERAAAAVRRYTGDSRDSREIQQLAAEVSHISDLVDRPIEALLQERKGLSNAEAEQYFRERLKNPVLLLDSYIGPKPQSEPGPASYRVENAIVLGQDKIRIDITNLKLFTSLSHEGSMRVLFLARIQTIDSGARASEWTIRLVPDSAVFLTSVLCAEKLGWPMDESTRELLESQAKRVLEVP
jgi:hypothetical protein